MSDGSGTNVFLAVLWGSFFAFFVGFATLAFEHRSRAVLYFAVLAVIYLYLFVLELRS